MSYIGKHYNDYKLQKDTQSIEENSIQRAVKTTIQKLYDEKLFDNYNSADEVIKIFQVQEEDLIQRK